MKYLSYLLLLPYLLHAEMSLDSYKRMQRNSPNYIRATIIERAIDTTKEEINKEKYRLTETITAKLLVDSVIRSKDFIMEGDTLTLQYSDSKTLYLQKLNFKDTCIIRWKQVTVCGPGPTPIIPDSGSIYTFLQKREKYFSPAARKYSFKPLLKE